MNPTPTLTPDTIPTPNPQVISRIVEGEAVLLIPTQGKVRVLNETGAAVWELLNGQRSIRQIAAILSEQFDVSEQTAIADTLRFVAALVERGAVLHQPAANSG